MNGDDGLSEALRAQAPMNMERAYQVMEQNDLQGIVVGDPLNVFHCSGFWPQMSRTKFGQPPTTFVLISRDPKRACGLVMSQFAYYYTYCDSGYRQNLQTYLYLDGGGALEFTDRELVPLSGIERRRRESLNVALTHNPANSDAAAALVTGMRDLELWHGKIAVDHELIAAVCEHHHHPGQCVRADQILRKIRIIKSPLEIALMRRAAAANAAAVQATASMIRVGMTYAELRQTFYQAAVARGNLPVFMTIDRVSAPLADARVTEGQVFFIDGVSHYENYHGDYARTVFVGEPAPLMKRAAAAVAFGWGEIRERLRPGLRYSQIALIGREALRKAGHPFSVGFGPHSVGLSHTDEPALESGGFYMKDDLVLQKNMILSVDCPIVDTGLGGSAHIEDLVLITADGALPLHDVGGPTINV